MKIPVKLDVGLTLIRFEGIQQVVKRTSAKVRVPLIKEEFGNKWPCQVTYRIFWEDDSSTEHELSFLQNDEMKNIEIKLRPVSASLPSKGKMAINLIEAKFTDKSRMSRKIKCTPKPLKLIIKDHDADPAAQKQTTECRV